MSSDSAIHALAGAAGGMVSMAITYPLVNLSTRAQVETQKHADASTLGSIRRIIKAEGIAGLFDGLESSIAGIAVTNGKKPTLVPRTLRRDRLRRAGQAYIICSSRRRGQSYCAGKRLRLTYLRRQGPSARWKASWPASLLGAPRPSFRIQCMSASQAFEHSLLTIQRVSRWTINTQQMVQASLDDDDSQAFVQQKRDPHTGEIKLVKKLSLGQTIRKMYKKDGLAAFFRGLGPALILTINPIIAYTSFEQIKNVIIARRGAQRLPTGSQSITSKPTILPLSDLDNFLLGAFCKLLATGSLYPYLVVKASCCTSRTAMV